MELSVILLLVFAHWVADFVLQTRKIADNKGKNAFILATHVGIYTIALGFMMLSAHMFNLADFSKGLILFLILTYVFHFITDFITSRIAGYYYRTKKIKAFFTTIGFDQLLHYFQLFICYKLIMI